MRKKNNARESAKISLAFSLAFILQIQQLFQTFPQTPAHRQPFFGEALIFLFTKTSFCCTIEMQDFNLGVKECTTMSFSELLKQCRKQKGISQAELASKLGVTQQLSLIHI